MSNFLNQLAVESGLVSNEEETMGDDTTVAELINEANDTTGPGEMIEHASKARDIADQLDELADQAEELADEDEKYAEVATESLVKQFRTIVKANGLKYTPTRAESAFESKGRKTGLVDDVRFVAKDLRNNADLLDTFSAEGFILDLFKTKNAQLKKAVDILKRDFGSMKGVMTALNENAVPIQHNGIAWFLTKDGKPVMNLKEAVMDDISYLDSLAGIVEDQLGQLEGVKVNDDAVTNTLKPVQALDFDKELMGGWSGMGGMEDGAVSMQFNPPGTFKRTMKALPWTLLKSVVGGNIASLLTYSALVPFIGPAAIVPARVIAALAGVDVGDQSVKDAANKSKVVSVAELSDLQQVVDAALALERYTKMDATYKRLDVINDKLKVVKLTDGAVAKEMKYRITLVKQLLDVINKHAFYLVTNIATLVEYTNKQLVKR